MFYNTLSLHCQSNDDFKKTVKVCISGLFYLYYFVGNTNKTVLKQADKLVV